MARKILLADDSVTAQNMGRKILADAGYEVLTVNNGNAALKRIAESRPDLIILDVYMPGYSGLEVCQRLKENAETSRIPILLTVGKLEPFKPEEAKRARAEGFIVKPFEASELLSALAKLEDKIVPLAEPSKPGRFARAIAAVEEGRYDKTVAIDEDAGWKDRISFPSKKKKGEASPPAREEADDSAIYNPVNKDLRTVVDRKAGDNVPDRTAAATAPEAKPEEFLVDLGALAPEGLPKDVTPEEIAALAAAAAQVMSKVGEEPAETQPTASAATVKSAPSSAAYVQPIMEAPAQQPAQEKIETSENHAAGAKVASTMPFIVAKLEPEPVTMAVAAPEAAPRVTRWTAVAVAVSAEEATLVLEEEMRKAYAAVSPPQAEGAPEPPAAGNSDAVEPPMAAQQVETTSVDAVAPEPSLTEASKPEPIPAVEPVAVESVAQEAAQTTDGRESKTIPAAKHFERVGRHTASFTTYSESVPEEPVASVEAPAALAAQQGTAIESNVAETIASEPFAQEAVPSTVPESQAAATLTESHASAVVEETPAAAHSTRKASITETPTIPPEAALSSEKPSYTHFDHGKKESDIAATTAAAWANWHRIRESRDSRPGPSDQESRSAAPRDEAAMAAAAGAEKPPEESAASAEAVLESSPEIASIVDSVLADLRPKIVAEISKKMGKKK